MHVIVDHCVPRSVWDYLENRGHIVVRSSIAFGKKTPDEVIAAGAAEKRAILVSWNRTHFAKLYRDLDGRASMILYYKCPETEGKNRLETLIDVIEWFGERFETGVTDSFLVYISPTYFKLLR